MIKTWLFLIFFSLMNFKTSSWNKVEPVIKDFLIPSSSTKLSGYIGRKLDSSYINRILAQDPDRLITPFNNRTETSCWQSEFWGKWFTSAVLVYRYRPEERLKSVLSKAVDGLLATQTPDGYIGNYADDRHLQSWDIWGRKYCMLGLLAYYDLTQDNKALSAAARLADHLMLELKQKNVSIVKMGNHRGMAASSILEPICLLYSRTGEIKYLDFAREIVHQWESTDGPQLISQAGVDVASRFPKPEKNWYGWEQGQKAYEMMSCYEGLLELYRLTGEVKYKQAVEQAWDNISKTEINIAGSGSSVECWFHGKAHQAEPVYHYQETCVTATWIKLSQQLLRLTGEAKYADAIETRLTGSYFEIRRRWQDGDKIQIDFDMAGQVVKLGTNPGHIAITWGPLVLSRDSRLAGPALEAIIGPVLEPNGLIHLKKVTPFNPEIWLQFEVSCIPESYAEGGAKPIAVQFCDYASAGNSMDSFPFFKVWLPQLFDPRK